jgi:N-acetyl-anhydromuramyl-L-alanine amidase AmpD
MQFDSNGWLDIATEIDYSANSMSRQGYSIKYLVLHGTAGGTSAQGVGQYFKSTVGGSNPVSSHLIIDQQGNVVQGVPMSLAAFANGIITNGHAAYLPDPSINPNWYTVSIEFVKPSTDNSDALTDIQAKVGFEVIKCICDTYNIPKRPGDANGGIIKHADIDPINRSRCPGTFPWDALWAYLANGGNTMNVPNGWSDDGHTLKAPDGTPVILGFRDHVLNSNWDPTNVPLEPEQHELILEQSNPSLGSGQRQRFRWKTLEYTQKMGVFEAWTGPELLWYEQQYKQLLAKVADLQQQLNKDTQAQKITQLQAQNDQLKALLDASNLGKINSLAQQIVDLSHVQ